ncbi:MAG: hypothetical protein ABJN40_12130 [Sneathiella sp.]
MQKIDFTDLLTATVPGIPRANLIKFNNSWLHLETNADASVYLVAYRALAYRDEKNSKGDWAFATPPIYQGMQGTSWAAGWCRPKGNANKEAQVPEGRYMCYFDGVGIAKIEVQKKTDDPSDFTVVVLDDYILENTDGYEDPRLFRSEQEPDKIYLHAHRRHPDPVRKAGDFPIANSSKEILAESVKDGPKIFVKVIELKKSENKYSKGNEFFYGLNHSQIVEKNYGFFIEEGGLNAVYSVASYGLPLTLFRHMLSDGPKEMSSLLVDRYQPHLLQYTNSSIREGIPELQAYFEINTPSYETVMFSTGGPLIKSNDDKHWIGAGHVKIHYPTFFNIIGLIWKSYKKFTKAKFFEGEKIYTDIVDFFASDAVVKKTLNIVASDLNQKKTQIKEDDMKAFFMTIPVGFLKHPIFKFLVSFYSDHDDQMLRIEFCKNAQQEEFASGSKLILHPDTLYLTFLYEINDSDGYWALNRFSDAFVYTDPAKPCMLQFATNLAKYADGYLMGIGENDFRSSAIFMTENEVEELLRHKPKDFLVTDYDFKILPE